MFVERESYKHKMAKDVVKSWFTEFDESDMMDILLEYPITKHNWSDIYLVEGAMHICSPTYAECISTGDIPIAIIDIVVIRKGYHRLGVEICHTHPVPKDKIQKLKIAGVTNLIEMDADWILSQIKRPSSWKYKVLLCDDDLDSVFTSLGLCT
jgi:hypothetical protein